jgi:hypothetical protein
MAMLFLVKICGSITVKDFALLAAKIEIAPRESVHEPS